MHDKKIENILKLSEVDRYDYFIREVIKLEEIWAASTEDNWLMINDGEDTIFPIWPHKELLQYCSFEEWNKYEWHPTKIDLDKFMKYCIPDMRNEKVVFGVFYNNQRSGLAVFPEKLNQDLIFEIESYE